MAARCLHLDGTVLPPKTQIETISNSKYYCNSTLQVKSNWLKDCGGPYSTTKLKPKFLAVISFWHHKGKVEDLTFQITKLKLLWSQEAKAEVEANWVEASLWLFEMTKPKL